MFDNQKGTSSKEKSKEKKEWYISKWNEMNVVDSDSRTIDFLKSKRKEVFLHLRPLSIMIRNIYDQVRQVVDTSMYHRNMNLEHFHCIKNTKMNAIAFREHELLDSIHRSSLFVIRMAIEHHTHSIPEWR